jgi:N-methylhydantoinase B/oxoprolinase/acetone carboxylase alpha subunit
VTCAPTPGGHCWERFHSFGTAGFEESIADVIAPSEVKARQAIARLTPGSYEFSDYLETYGSDGHIFMHARMTVEGETLAMDFSGSDP